MSVFSTSRAGRGRITTHEGDAAAMLWDGPPASNSWQAAYGEWEARKARRGHGEDEWVERTKLTHEAQNNLGSLKALADFESSRINVRVNLPPAIL